MNFLENILSRLAGNPDRIVIEEMHPEKRNSATAGHLLQSISAARGFLTDAGLRPGDRCAILGANSILWTAIDLACMAEGVIVVPLYARQAPVELVAMMRDCQPALLCCGDDALRESLRQTWPDGPRSVLFRDVIAANRDKPTAPAGSRDAAPIRLDDATPITIIYTSGTSGEAKGVVLNIGNVSHMLSCTTARLDLLMGPRSQADQVFHYLPLCFAGSWILMLSCLSRHSVLRLSMDLARLADELREAEPDYCLNVPALLERMRSAVEKQLAERGGVIYDIFRGAQVSWLARQSGTGCSGALSLAIARALIFPTIRKKLGRNLKALICGSAPLALETQLFFMMIGIRVLQVYGLTETTAICTMDHPDHVEPGTVGPAISGIDMKLGEGDEILVRGPNVFPGYWNRRYATEKMIIDGWLLTGDRGERTPAGNWRILGRIKNLLILSSGHNIAPEPLEERLVHALPGAHQVVLFGHGQSHLVALITGDVKRDVAEAEFARMNAALPHYRRIHAFHIEPQPLTIESGLLTANGKLRRDATALHFRAAIEAMYERKAT